VLLICHINTTCHW